MFDLPDFCEKPACIGVSPIVEPPPAPPPPPPTSSLQKEKNVKRRSRKLTGAESERSETIVRLPLKKRHRQLPTDSSSVEEQSSSHSHSSRVQDSKSKADKNRDSTSKKSADNKPRLMDVVSRLRLVADTKVQHGDDPCPVDVVEKLVDSTEIVSSKKRNKISTSDDSEIAPTDRKLKDALINKVSFSALDQLKSLSVFDVPRKKTRRRINRTGFPTVRKKRKLMICEKVGDRQLMNTKLVESSDRSSPSISTDNEEIIKENKPVLDNIIATACSLRQPEIHPSDQPLTKPSKPRSRKLVKIGKQINAKVANQKRSLMRTATARKTSSSTSDASKVVNGSVINPADTKGCPLTNFDISEPVPFVIRQSISPRVEAKEEPSKRKRNASEIRKVEIIREPSNDRPIKTKQYLESGLFSEDFKLEP
jgi:hypothetical protein